MPVVCVASPNGKVGKTALAATIGVGVHKVRWRVLALDCDRENAPRPHFKLSRDNPPDITNDGGSGRDWTELAIEASSGVFVIPFGNVTACASAYIGDNPGCERRQLTPFFENCVLAAVVVDTPSGPSVYEVEINVLADLHVAVLLADAMSLAVPPRMRRGQFRGRQRVARFLAGRPR